MRKEGYIQTRLTNHLSVVIAASMMIFGAVCSSSIHHSYITFTSGTVRADDAPAALPHEVFPGAVITCEPNSLAVLQVGDAIACVLRSGAKVEYNLNPAESSVEVKLEKGNLAVLNKTRTVRVNIAAGDVTLVAGKGAFDIAYDGTALSVSAFEGSAEIVRAQERKNLRAGEKFELYSDAALVSAMSTQEKRMYALLHRVKFIDLSHANSAAPSSIVPMPVVMEMIALSPEHLSEKLGMQALARKEGPLSVITTKKGARIIGHVRARGKLVDVATREGMRTIAQKDILSMSPYSALR